MPRNYYRTERQKRGLSELPIMIFVFSICLICWGVGYFYSIGFPILVGEGRMALWNFIGKIFINKEIAYIIGFLTLLTSGFAMQRISDTEMLARERTRLPFMLFMLLFSANAFLLPVSEATIIMICLAVYFFELFRSYQMPEATTSFFVAGLMLGIMSLFVPQMLFFLPLMWIGMYKLRVLEWKSFLASLVAVLMIYWIQLAWCVWINDFSLFTELWNDLIHIRFFALDTLLQYEKSAIWGVVILVIISLIYTRIYSFASSVHTRMMLSFLTDNIILSMVLIFLYSEKSVLFQATLFVPASVLIARFLRNIRQWIMIPLFFVFCLVLLFSFMISIKWIF